MGAARPSESRVPAQFSWRAGFRSAAPEESIRRSGFLSVHASVVTLALRQGGPIEASGGCKALSEASEAGRND